MRRGVSLSSLVLSLLVVALPTALGDVPAMVPIAGTGSAGFSGDDGAATAAQLDNPSGIAVDDQGNVFVADTFNHRIRRIDVVTGIITTFAGTGTPGATGDGGQAAAATLNYPEGLVFDLDGNLVVADFGNNKIRRIDMGTGVIETIAGTGGAGFTGDGGPATAATFANPVAVTVDGAGNIYVTDLNNSAVRKIDTAGDIDTIAGTGSDGFSGDGGPATAAELYKPQGVVVDADGNVFIADTFNHRIRMIDVSTGDIDTIAGDGTSGGNGDGGPAADAQLSTPMGLGLFDGDLYLADYGNASVRIVDGDTGNISTVAPIGAGSLATPFAIALDDDGDLFVVQPGVHRVQALAVSDTDGDGFADLVDNFPTVYSKCRTSQATIIGTGGNDNPLNGTADADVIMGLGGADVIYGLGGDDLICAGNGADTVYGGDGKDAIYGENGPDTIYGNEKSDRLYGGDNDDVIRGGDGTRDRLYGGAGTNDLDGGAGTDDRCTLGPTFNRCEILF